MKAIPFVSIIIATYNVKEHLDCLIASLNNQTFTDYEVLISDGGSSDGSVEYFNNDTIRNLAWSKSGKDKGIYYALNEALNFAAGTWVVIIGADDRLIDNNSLLCFYEATNGLDHSCRFIYTDLQIRSKNTVRFKSYPAYPDFKKKYGGSPPLHHQTVFVKNECIKKYGMFNTDYLIHADYELLCRIMAFEEPKKLDISIISFNDSGFSSNWANIIKSLREIIKIRSKYNNGRVGIRIFLPYLKIIANKTIFKFFNNNTSN
jgi:glycosyltransferase involved in cell wall biosynthesis